MLGRVTRAGNDGNRVSAAADISGWPVPDSSERKDDEVQF